MIDAGQQESRMGNSMKNFFGGMISRIILILLNFVVRTAFIHFLGEVYLSVNGLYANILTILSLAEMGVGSAITFSMYQPLATKNEDKLRALMLLYKKIYRWIGLVVLVLGLLVIPFMDIIIKDKPDLPYLTVYYLLFLGDSALSYFFFSYKRSILFADQHEYMVIKYNSIVTIGKIAVQIVSLYVYQSFFLFLVIQAVSRIVENFLVAKEVDRTYPYLREKSIYHLTNKEKAKMKNDVSGLFLSRIGHILLSGSDNILISSIVNLMWVGVLSNYVLIIDSVTSVLFQISSALRASLGNYFVEKDKEEGYALFLRLEFLHTWLYAFAAMALLVLLDPFIFLWIGSDFVLGMKIAGILAVNFFIQGYLNALWVFRTALGLFSQGKYRPIISAAVNILLGFILGYQFGVFGILFAKFLTRILVNIWYDPLVLHRNGFDRSMIPFLRIFLKRAVLILCISIVLYGIQTVVFASGITIIRFICMAVITVIIPLVVFWLIYRKTENYRFFWKLFRERVLEKIIPKKQD